MKSQNNMDCFIILSDFCFLLPDAFAGLTVAESHISSDVLQHNLVLFLRILPSAASSSSPWKPCNTGCWVWVSSAIVVTVGQAPPPFSSSIPLSHCHRTRMCSVICGERSRGSASHTCIHPLSCCSALGALRTEEKNRKKKQNQIRIMMCVCSHPSVLILLLFLSAAGGGLSIGVNPSLFQLALDTPAPSEPTPTQASRHSQLCEGRPCLNGGSCLALPSSHNQENTFNQEYTCSCSPDFTGRNCEVRTCYCVMCLKAVTHTKLVYLKETQQSHHAKVVLCLQIWLVVKC